MDAGDGEVYLFHNSSAVRLYHHFALHEYTVHAHGTFRCKCVISQPAEILMSLPRRQHVPCIKMSPVLSPTKERDVLFTQDKVF